MGEWDEVQAKTPTPVDDSVLSSIDLDELSLSSNKTYLQLVSELQGLHAELLTYERTGKLGNYVENPSLIGDYLGKLRLNANKLFAYMNIYIDILSDLQREYAAKRQDLYIERLALPKGSISSAEKHAREMTRVDEAKIGVIQNNMQRVKNEYERYNGICMYLQSRMKEFNTERQMG